MDDLLLDACVAINVVAAGVDLEELAGASAVRLVMTSVAATEALWLAPLEPDGDRDIIDVRGLIDTGTLALLELLDDELNRFVDFAREIDDGEAATFAVAATRGLRVVTDDRRAQRLAAAIDPPISIVGTSQLLRTWADANGVSPGRVAEVVRSIELRASYIPRRDDPHFAWWIARRDSA